MEVFERKTWTEQLAGASCAGSGGATGAAGVEGPVEQLEGAAPLFFASNGSDSQLLPAAGSDQLGMLNAGSVVVVVVEIKTAVASQQMKTTHLSWGWCKA